ncbi:hypothetical protein REPUB_Repub03eG0126000 [Reevesia pubescens]
MADDLYNLWSKLSLTEDEQTEIFIQDDDVGNNSVETLGGLVYRMQGLTIGLMIENARKLLGQTMREVEEMDSGSRFLRARVHVNIHNPLKRCSRISTSSGNKILVGFRYKRLHEFCYICGMLDHQETECKMAFQMKKQRDL